MSWIKKYKPGITFYHLGILLVVSGILVSAVAVIKVSQKSRELFTRYHKLQLVEQNYQDEFGRLQLQEGSESAMHNLAVKAKRELGMFVPGAKQRHFIK